MPVGEYDRHAIGHKDYEKLADEIMTMKPLTLHHGSSKLSEARHIAEKAKSYIQRTGESKDIDSILSAVEDLVDESSESSYSEMIDIINRNDLDLTTEEDEF